MPPIEMVYGEVGSGTVNWRSSLRKPPLDIADVMTTANTAKKNILNIMFYNG